MNNLSITPLKFDKQFRSDFCLIFKKYFATGVTKSIVLLILISACALGSVEALVALNENSKEIFNALSSYNTHSYIINSYHLGFIILALMLTNGYSSYFVGILAIRWRRFTTHGYIARWLEERRYYLLKLGLADTDNPDQRIAADLEELPNLTLFLYPLLLNSVFSLCTFGITLWKASVPISFSTSQIKIPGLFFLCALLVSILGTWITSIIARKLSALNYDQEKYNANFRAALIKLQEASDEVALYHGETVEKNKIAKSFIYVITNSLAINKIKKRLTFFSQGFNQASVAIGFLIAAPFYLTKQLDMGTFMLVTGAFAYTTNSFSIFVQVFQALTQWRATLHRIAEFEKVLGHEKLKRSPITHSAHEKHHIEVRQLQIHSPENDPLLENLNFQLSPGYSYLIKGPTGTGKSTLFKAIANLWPYGSGTILLPKNSRILFLPQRPYLFEGTLQENLMYPNLDAIELEQMIAIMEEIGLGHFVSKLNIHDNWQRILSLGQQQLLGFGRILIHKPNVVFLDESTSALDEITQLRIYKILKKRLPQAIILSIGHRTSLEKLHDFILVVQDRTMTLAEQSYKQTQMSAQLIETEID